MIRVNDRLEIPDQYIQEEFFGSSGPGGQNVNKVSTAVRLRLYLAAVPLPEEIKSRLFARLKPHLTETGELVCVSRIHRTQLLNRQEAMRRMEQLLHNALLPVKKRRPTAPTGGSVKRRINAKKELSETKLMRRKIEPHES